MRLRDPNILAGALISALVGLLVIPATLARDALLAPYGLWLAVYVAMFAAMQVTQWLDDLVSRRQLHVIIGVMLATSWAVVLLSGVVGFMPIVLVVSAALCAYHLGPRPVRVIVVANTGIAVLGTLLGGAPFAVLVLVGTIYLILQFATTMGITSEIRQDALRTELEVANTELLAAQVLLSESSRTQERLRIARELHDVIGHQLTGLILELEIASHHARGETHEHVVRARSIARDLLGDVRTAVGEQRDVEVDLGAVLEAVVAPRPGLDIDVEVDPAVQARPAQVTVVVRCLQEVVTNTLRHSSATRLRIRIGCEGDAIAVECRDDGVGYRTLRPGNGLRGMRERIEDAGGTLELDGSNGFQVRARLPHPTAA